MNTDDHSIASTATPYDPAAEPAAPLTPMARPFSRTPAPGDRAAALGSALDRVVPMLRANADGGDVEARRAEVARLELARFVRELSVRADARGVPQHPGLRAVVLATHVERPSPALLVLERALRWRAETRSPGAAPHPLTVGGFYNARVLSADGSLSKPLSGLKGIEVRACFPFRMSLCRRKS